MRDFKTIKRQLKSAQLSDESLEDAMWLRERIRELLDIIDEQIERATKLVTKDPSEAHSILSELHKAREELVREDAAHTREFWQ